MFTCITWLQLYYFLFKISHGFRWVGYGYRDGYGCCYLICMTTFCREWESMLQKQPPKERQGDSKLMLGCHFLLIAKYHFLNTPQEFHASRFCVLATKISNHMNKTSWLLSSAPSSVLISVLWAMVIHWILMWSTV